jgi:hypothetical protein
MLRKGLAVALGAGLLVGMVGHADAAKKKHADDGTVTLSGCARFWPPFCTVLNAGGQNFSLQGAVPAIPVNASVTVVGVKSGDISLCFGTPVRVVRWRPNRLHCPAM